MGRAARRLDRLHGLIEESYRAVAPKKLIAKLDVGRGQAAPERRSKPATKKQAATRAKRSSAAR